MKTLPVEINGKQIPCHLKRKAVRLIYLRLKPGPILEIVLPRNKDIDLEALFEKKRRWLEKKIKEISQAKKLFEDDTLLYRGEPFEIKVCPTEKLHCGVRISKKVFFVYLNSRKTKKEVLIDFLTTQTLEYTQEKAQNFARKIGVLYKTVATKETKRWGYCTRDGNIFFNWRLICLPESLIDYIVLHEVLHLKHFNHSPQFKKEMAKYLVDFKEREKQLKTYILNDINQ